MPKLREERAKRRIHTTVPWIVNPLQGVDKASLVFSPRHEASTLELFFDLFFVANLATFTTYHAIVDHSSLFAYIGFFAIIWASWFHTVLYDVRFENDSIYTRACKTVIMIAFVGFALVGSAFAPGTTKGDNTSFRVLCYTLIMSRVLFAVQYLVVGVFVVKARRTDIYLPIILNALVYVIAAVAFGAMLPAFRRNKPVDESNGIYSVWWIVMAVESVAVIAISSIWRMLSFKKTHLVERMGLLTLIVIGEGAIGVTKTISRMMGKHGLDPEGSGMVLCIVLLLVGIWMLYFDNHPHGHFGTIKQQIWSLLHFPIHLAIVGLVEGAQQTALARYMSVTSHKFEKSLYKYCFQDHLDGGDLVIALDNALKYLKLEKKLGGLIYVDRLNLDLETIGKTAGICGAGVRGSDVTDLPQELQILWYRAMSALYSSLGLAIPNDADALQIMVKSWQLVYRYFWGSFIILMVCFLAAVFLIRRNRLDAYYITSFLNRGVVIAIGAVFLGLSATVDTLGAIMEKPVILPVAVCLIYGIVLSDRLGMLIANYRNRRSGDPLAHDDHHGHHGGGGGGSHGEKHGDSHGNHRSEHQPLAGGRRSKSKDNGPRVSSVRVPGSHESARHHHSRQDSYNPLGGGSVMPSYYHEDTSYSSPASAYPDRTYHSEQEDYGSRPPRTRYRPARY